MFGGVADVRHFGWFESDAIPLTILATVALAMLLLVVRILILQRLFTRRQTELRQTSERTRALLAIYRALAGSFTPAQMRHAAQIEEALADLIVFGNLQQVQLAAQAVRTLQEGQVPDLQPLIANLRAELRLLLKLDALPADLALPPAGPGRSGIGRARSGTSPDTANP